MDFISDDLYGNNPELEFKKREYVYLSSIASLEFELERLKNTFSGLPLESLSSLSNNDVDTTLNLDGIPVHPLVKLELERLKKEVQEKDILLETATTEMNVATFDAQSLIGQRLVLKCKVLQEENKYLGKKILTLKCANPTTNSKYEYQDFLEGEIKKLHCIIEDLEIENERLSNTLKSLNKTYTPVATPTDRPGDRIHDNYLDNTYNKKDNHEGYHKSDKYERFEKSDKYDIYERCDRYEEKSYRSKHDSHRNKPHSNRHRDVNYSRRSASKSPGRSRSYRSPYHSHSHSHSSRHRHHN